MNFFKKIINGFKTHNELITRGMGCSLYETLPQETKKLICHNCGNNLFDVIDSNNDETITLGEVIKYSAKFGGDIYKTIKKDV